MPRHVEGVVSYLGAMTLRPRYHAQDHARDNLVLDPRRVEVEDLRDCGASLSTEGFALVPHRSAVADFRDEAEVARIHGQEIEALLLARTGADRVVVTGRGILRFSERSPLSGKLFNSQPARFIHIDVSDATAREFAERSKPDGAKLRRYAHYNVWRVISEPPQDVPLALCDARSLAPDDLVTAEAVFDAPGGGPEWSFEGLLVRHSPHHRWCYFSGMTRDEAIVFKTNDSDPAEPHHVPHSAFDDPSCPPGAAPRASIEMRAIAYWFD
ncbi:MAG TPA: CmcJ/NvfI family oxidoreductase [Rhizomicrobium sp.]